MTGIRELSAATPAYRVRHIDLLRAVAITAVVLGHWLVMVVEYDGQGRLTGYTALRDLAWAHPVTWLFQVMPVFFMVGGFANAASLAAHHRSGGGGWVAWLLDRSARLVRPTTVLMVALAGGALLARVLGAEATLIGEAVWLASLPLWFLIAYLGMVALTPVMHALHRRAGGLVRGRSETAGPEGRRRTWPMAVPLLLVVPVALGDVLRLRYGQEAYAYGSFLFGWLAIHQIGFCWRDGLLPAGRRAAGALLAGGLGAAWLLIHPGPYPVSMITAPGQTMANSSPPSLALLALATAQLGLALLLRGPCERWLQRSRPWTVVVAVNSVILTVFLWHMTAAVLATLGLHALGRLPTPPVDSPEWLLWQVPWVAMLAVVLAGLVAVFGRVETRAAAGRAPGPGPGRRPAKRTDARAPDLAQVPPRGLLTGAGAVAGYAGVIGGLLWQAAAGRGGSDGPFGFPAGALALFLAGAAVLRAARHLDPATAQPGEHAGHAERARRPEHHERRG